jgi:hypothetical protein
MPSNEPPEVPPVPAHIANASEVLSVLNTELTCYRVLSAKKAAETDSMQAPTSYQTYRYFIGALKDAQDLLHVMCKVAEVQLRAADEALQSDLLNLAECSDSAESRVEKCMFGPFQLDNLPPGNPGEPDFERLLKPKIALNRAYSQLMHQLAVLHTALFSPTYKLDLTEEERLTAWRAHRKSELEKVLANIQAEIEDNLKYAAALAKAKENVEEKISTNDAMTFVTGIDSEKTPESGD